MGSPGRHHLRNHRQRRLLLRRGRIAIALLAAATLILNVPQLFRVFRAALLSCDSAVSPETALCQLLAEHITPGDDVFFVSSDDAREASVERALCQAAVWMTMPAPVRWGTGNGEWGTAQAVLTPYFDKDVNAAIAATRRYQEAGGVAGRRLWVKNEGTGNKERGTGEFSTPLSGSAPSAALRDKKCTTPNRPTAEAAGLLPLLAVCLAGGIVAGVTGVFAAVTFFSLLLFALVLCGITSPVSVWLTAVLSAAAVYIIDHRFWNPKPETRDPKPETRNLWPLLIGAIVLGATGLIARAHPFVTPYGLAITGGRAKLWFLSRGIPSGFFTDSAWRLLEPAYPPGCAALTFGCYGAAGFCGDWLTQLAPCVFAAVAAAFLASRTKDVARLWLALLFLTPVALMTTGQFYPEPLMALGVLVGWERVRDGRSCGWLLLGAAGWFKNEGLFLLIAAWLAWRIIEGSRRASVRDLVCAMALPLAWHVGCRIAGASLNDYVAPWRLSPMRGLRALGESLTLAFLRPWRYGFAYPAAVVAVLIPSVRRQSRPLMAALLFATFALGAFSLAYACSMANENWHISTSLPRLLWTPALVLACEFAGKVNQRE